FVLVEYESGGLGRAVELSDRNFDGHDFLVELAALLRLERLLMAVVGEHVTVFPGHSILALDTLGGESHAHVQLRLVVDNPGIRSDFVATHWDHAHRLGAARDDDVRGAGANAIGGQSDGLQPGGAIAVDGESGNGDRQAGPKRYGSGKAHAGF